MAVSGGRGKGGKADEKMNADVVVAGVKVPVALDGLTITYNDVDYDAGRVADGTMKRNRVATKRTIDITTPLMEPAEMAGVLRAMSGEHFRVSFLDPMSNSRTEGTFYSGDKPAPVYSSALGLYNSTTFNLVEV